VLVDVGIVFIGMKILGLVILGMVFPGLIQVTQYMYLLSNVLKSTMREQESGAIPPGAFHTYFISVVLWSVELLTFFTRSKLQNFRSGISQYLQWDEPN
jgi:hypothetical protein